MFNSVKNNNTLFNTRGAVLSDGLNKIKTTRIVGESVTQSKSTRSEKLSYAR